DHLVGGRRLLLQAVPKSPQPEMGEALRQMAIIDPVIQLANALAQPAEVLPDSLRRLIQVALAFQQRPRGVEANLETMQGLFVLFLGLLEIANGWYWARSSDQRDEILGRNGQFLGC